ncbi:hypothetical protein BEL04_09890 [Mucilaginibacter sp. PPCGB 2223]|nr:hypothetical protein BEL04_09890 [Mucilaginibacter sp. PPCGB 2223]
MVDFDIDIVTRLKATILLIVFLLSSVGNIFLMKSRVHTVAQNHIYFKTVNDSHISTFSLFHPREKNFAASGRSLVPKIKFSGVIFILTVIGSLNLIPLIKLPQPRNSGSGNFRKLCIALCILKI